MTKPTAPIQLKDEPKSRFTWIDWLIIGSVAVGIALFAVAGVR